MVPSWEKSLNSIRISETTVDVLRFLKVLRSVRAFIFLSHSLNAGFLQRQSEIMGE